MISQMRSLYREEQQMDVIDLQAKAFPKKGLIEYYWFENPEVIYLGGAHNWTELAEHLRWHFTGLWLRLPSAFWSCSCP